MVDVKIAGLPNAAALTGNEQIPGVQGGGTVKLLVSAIRAGMASDSSVVHTTGDESIGGVKTFTANSNWNLSANGRIVYGEPGGDSAGISLFRGDWNAGAARRSDIRARSGDLLLGCGSASDNAAPVNWVSIGPAHVRPTIPGTLNLGTVGNAWLNTFTAELTLTGDDAAKARSRASIQAVGLIGNETIAGTKTFSQTGVFALGMRMPGDTARLVMGDGSIENGSIRATTTNALVVAAGPGTAGSTGQIIFRPNGNTVTTGQVTIIGTGAITFGGDAASKLATMSSLGAVNDSGSQTIAGNKTFSGASLFTGSITQRTGTVGGVEIQSPTGLPGIVGRNGDPADVNNQYRHDIHFGAGFVRMLASTAVGSTAPAGGWRMDAHFYPVQNNTMSCGTPSNLWTQVCSTNGTINTSDARLKTPLDHMTDAEEAAFLEISSLPMKWKWKVRVAEEGDDARWHAGPSVQAAIAVMEKHGLVPFSYSAFCYDSWPAQDEVWREWPAEPEEVVEWPAVPEQWHDVPAVPEQWREIPEVPEQWVDIPAELDSDGNTLSPAHRVLVQEAVPASRELVQEAVPAYRMFVHPAIEAGRAVLKEAIEAGRELVQPAIAAGDRYSFRISELHAWILAATARRDRREREAVELRLASIEQRLAVLESGK
ncbi:MULTISPECIES: tail fiber domain-containing protein [Stenotrophomonas]|uniref:tail fiber domain-containing protein n=1 Tax=Stenotrophomonas TaxID=40323 RepID=UPI00018FE75E|nr:MULTISPECIES: tail fiber domain-containing protein [Stenotrophomonas]EED38043.1 hypothetical protein SSKA14_1052 [Stenotrophomonas sp. SKA14]EKU9979305.1 tail fiber domain-containing protein [Stenotrophomonas maltophilia]EKX6271074.1 tail fiber domain-containing protein [Stenotrophomonas maltophilia]MBA0360688.1 tail fiber domain-containing protein [Stenotrophomonas maltophilia]